MQAHRKKWFNVIMAAVVLLGGMWTGWGVATAHAVCGSPIIYVKMAADGGNDTYDGCSWNSAYATLQQALDRAAVGDQIWIAKGTYNPTKQAGGSGDRYRTIQMKNGVSIYGGFAGNEPETFPLADRNFTVNETILSGDFGTGDNAYHVFYNVGLNESAVLDGVTITGGNADHAEFPSEHQNGGGMYNNNSSPTLTNVTFSGNTAEYEGGGMNNNNSSPTLTNVTLSGNTARYYGGGMNNNNSSPMLTNVTFSGNEAGWYGGGMNNYKNSNPTLMNVTLSGNTAEYEGGGVYNYLSNPTLTNVTLSDNRADEGGGMYNGVSSPTLTNVTISGNASNKGGGMYNYYSNPTLTNVTLSGNMADNGGGMYNHNVSSPNIRNSIIWDNSSGIINDYSSNTTELNSLIQDESGIGDPMFRHSPGPSAAPTTAGDYRLQVGSPAIGAGEVSLYHAGQVPDLSANHTDIDLNPRIVNGKIDMGAYQYQADVVISRLKWDITKGLPVQYDISLLTEPEKDVVVIPTSSSNLRLSPAALTFTPANWHVPQTVTVTVEDAANIGGMITEKITHSTRSDFALYNELPVDPVVVTIYKEGTTWPPDSALNVSDITQTSVKLSWPLAKGYIGGYQIYKDDLLIDDLASDIFEYQVTGLDPVTLYTFTVKAYDAANRVSEPGLQASPYTQIMQIEPFEIHRVAKGTRLEQLALPLTARIQLANGSEMEVPVVWDRVNTDFKPDQVGNYLVTGSIQLPGAIRNPRSLRAELTVEVLPGTDAMLSAIYVDGTTIEGFNPGIYIYTVHVPFTTERVTVTAATYDPSADYQVIGGHLQQLHVGDNMVGIIATAENGDVQPYMLNLNRASTVPNAPTNLIAAAGDGSATLNWNAVTGEGTVTYAVYQVAGTAAPADPKDWVLVQADVTSATYTVTGLTNGTSYAFGVTASDTVGTSSFSNVATATPRAAGRNGGSGNGRGYYAGGDSFHVISTNGTIAIPVGYSGEVSLDDEIVIKIPVGAAEQEQRITIEKQLEPSSLLTDQETLASHIFEVLKNFSGNFKKPVMLSLKIDPNKIGQNQEVAIFYYDEEKKTWIEVGGTVDGQWITAEIDHFTKFAVLVVDNKPEITFSDITGHWAEEQVKQAASLGIVNGYVDGLFKPNATITRTEFIVMLMNALKPEGDGAQLSFTDHATIGTWAQKAVAQSVAAGIVSGYSDGSLRPHANISRLELAVMIARAYEVDSTNVDSTGFVDDNDIPAWAKPAVLAVRESGIVKGVGNNRFAPNATATRAEAVVMIMNLLKVK